MHLPRPDSRSTAPFRAGFLSRFLLVLALAITVPGIAAGVVGAGTPPERSTYIVLGDAPALASYRGSIAGLAPTSPGVTGAESLDAQAPASKAYRAYVGREQRTLLAEMAEELDRTPDVLHRYDAALNGLALELTESEAAAVARLDGVKRVLADEVRYLQTDNGPAWIGAPSVWTGASTIGPGTQGEGVVVGVIDTGVNTDHPSFADVGPVDGYNHTNPKGRFFGFCDPVTGLPFCNDKLIGVYDFTGAPPATGEDSNGHGSHTASTAAGNVLNARLVAPTYTLERRISGVAPHANVISYRACQELTGAVGLGGCLLSALVAAIDQAVADEVDVINYSIGGGSANPWTDADALAFLNARRAGIFVAASAGNSGPGAGTIGSPADAPWLLSVGASTHDRRIVNVLESMAGGGSTPPPNMEGKSLTSGLSSRPIVYAANYGSALCGAGAANPDGSAASNPFPPGTFTGQIVVCDRGTYGRVEKAQNVMEGGAGGFVLANDAASGNSLVADAYPIPGVHITYDHGVALKAWLGSGTGHAAAIRGTTLDIADTNGDVMASFSSRGPNPANGDLLKPDVTAPGVDIFAAFHNGAGAHPQFGIISGTSMSSPHAAGAAALLVAKHPAWTPDEVRSALMTTAFTSTVRKENGTTPADPFDMGAGRIDLRLAATAGLVLDETPAGYTAANPSAGGDPKTLNLPSMADDSCDGFCSWTRVVRNPRSSTVTWTAAGVSSSPGVTITVAPKTFTLAAGASRTIIVTADVSEATPARWHFGQVVLTPNPSSIPAAHLPVAAFAKGDPPDTRPVLHMHGNRGTHDSGDPGELGCTGDGKTDLIACNGPKLLSSPNLSPEPAASWKGGPSEWALTGANDRTIHDPNWVWCLTVRAPQCPTTELPAPGAKTLEGPMTVEWWAECLTLCAASSPDWHVRLWADGVQIVNQRTPVARLVAGAVHKLRATVNVPRTTATQRLTVHLEPVFLVDQAVQFAIYYDSTQACPTASAGPCDSIVRMPVVDGGGGGENRAPDAVDDATTVQRGGSTVVAVLANDADPDGDSLTVDSVGAPTNGTATENPDGTITYQHSGDAATSDSFTYTISDGRGGSDTATVSVTITDEPPPPPGVGAKTTGGGWLATDAGGKLNFGFNASETASGFDGELQLNDKGAAVKIHLTDVVSLGAVQSGCGAVAAGPNAIELRGTGRYNGTDGASFRVCVEDNGEGAGAATGDRFYLECTSGCGSGYDTGSRTPDDSIDGGNVQVRQAAQPAASPAAAGSEQSAATLILDPLLLTEGVAGQAQLFTVRAYGPDQELLANAAVTLTRTSSTGAVETLTGLTAPTGTVVFSVVNLGVQTEYVATAGAAQSNAIEVSPLA